MTEGICSETVKNRIELSSAIQTMNELEVDMKFKRICQRWLLSASKNSMLNRTWQILTASNELCDDWFSLEAFNDIFMFNIKRVNIYCISYQAEH